MASAQPIISLKDVGKRYVKYEDVPTLITGLTQRRWKHRRNELWAVRHVDLEVAPGEGVGVIGRNGAGKSTMLSMLAGVTAPTEGVVTVRGRVAPLLRLGVGFHEELTGRENVYINATILGLTEKEIDGCFDEILVFSELEAFIDTPVKFYSSGMQARLGFSVAVASRPDILIVDEVLAVGDAAFQLRSFEKMLQMQDEGVTILVVSHNLDSIRRVCARVLILENGTPYFEGSSADAISRYHDLLRLSWDDVSDGTKDDRSEAEAGAPVEINAVELLDEQGADTANFASGVPMKVRLHIKFRRPVSDPICGIWVTNHASQLVYEHGSVGWKTGDFEAGALAHFDVNVGVHLVGGTYALGGWVAWGEGRLDVVRTKTRPFYVTSRARRGTANLDAKYQITQLEPSPRIVTEPPPTDTWDTRAATERRAP